MAIAYTIIVAHKAHEFVTTGNQGYPEANHLTSGGLVVALPLLLELGTLMLAIGCIWTSLSAMRVGLVTRMVGYVGVLAGALFLFPIGGLVPIVQGYWLAAIAVTLARRWPSGDPPAWESGTAVPWEPTQSQRARQDARGDARAAPPWPGVRHRSPRRGREGSAEGRSKGRARQAQTPALKRGRRVADRRSRPPATSGMSHRQSSLACSAWIFCFEGRHHGRVAQRRDVAQGAALGDVAQQPAHDLA